MKHSIRGAQRTFKGCRGAQRWTALRYMHGMTTTIQTLAKYNNRERWKYSCTYHGWRRRVCNFSHSLTHLWNSWGPPPLSQRASHTYTGTPTGAHVTELYTEPLLGSREWNLRKFRASFRLKTGEREKKIYKWIMSSVARFSVPKCGQGGQKKWDNGF